MNRTLKLQRILLMIIIVQLIIAFFAINAWSQTLNEDYNLLMEKSETYDKYKVVSKARLDGLWTNVQKEINSRDESIVLLQENAAEFSIVKDSLTAQINSLSKQLSQSEALNGSIPVLGIGVSHNIYHGVVWSIIGLLLIGIGYFGVRFKMSGGIVDQLLLEKEAIAAEFETHKFNAHQKMLKTKRELQTALNRLSEEKVHQ